MGSRIGILGYGSLISDPGWEIERVLVRRMAGVRTPFAVEFSRSSRVRDGAPTLVPVEQGGARARGVLLVLREGLSEAYARDLLYRRERNRVGSTDRYDGRDVGDLDDAVCHCLADFCGLDVVLYAALRANIREPTPRALAILAVRSAQGPSGAVGRDGISYLMAAKRDGIRTPLMPDYEKEILSETGTRSLEDALLAARRSAQGGVAGQSNC